MNPSEIDRFPVNQLQDRYELARSAVYKRMDQLGIAPARVGPRSYLNAQQLQLMDQLHAFIGNGGTATEFVEARGLGQKQNGQQDNRQGQPPNGSALTNAPGDVGGFIGAIVSGVVNRLGGTPEPDPMRYFETLESAAKNGWLPSTSELASLLDLPPQEIERSGDSFFEAGFIFRRAGYRKNGEIAWRVTKRLK
ncbi:MAG: hypothetical protein ACFCVD_20925 [Nodosilinea sp.]